MQRGSPPWKKNSLWLRTAEAMAGDRSALAVGSLVGEKLSNIDLSPRGIIMFLIAMSVKASDAFLQKVVIVEEVVEGFRISGKLSARATRSSLLEFRSRSRVACAYWVASVPKMRSALAAGKVWPCKAGEIKLVLLSWMSMDMWTELVSRSAYVLMSSVEVGSAERGEVNQRSCFWEVWRGVHLLLMKSFCIFSNHKVIKNYQWQYIRRFKGEFL